jgi:hypothetical protein
MKTSNWKTKRKKPYTTKSIAKYSCIRCQANQATDQWQTCADGNNWRPICTECDIQLNALVLGFMLHPSVRRTMEKYTFEKTGK